MNNKQKHLERNLSVAQRNALFIKKMKNNAEFRKYFLQIVGESIKEIAKPM